MMIQDLVLVQFNESVGKRILCSARALLQNASFKKIDQVLLPKDQMCLRFISLKLEHHFLATIPILLRSNSYKRSKFLFAPILVFHEQQYQRSGHYAYLLAHKISSIYANIQIEQRTVIQNRVEQLQAITSQLFDKVNKKELACFYYNSCHAFFNYQPISTPLKVTPDAVLATRQSLQLNCKELVSQLLQKRYCSLRKIAQANESSCQSILEQVTPKLFSKDVMQHEFFDLQNRFEVTAKIFSPHFMEDTDVRPFCRHPVEAAREVIKRFLLCLNKSTTIGAALRQNQATANLYIVKLVRWAVSEQIIRPVHEFFMPELQEDIRKKVEEFLRECPKELYKDQKLREVVKLIREGVWVQRLCSQLQISKKKCQQLLKSMAGHYLYF